MRGEKIDAPPDHVYLEYVKNNILAAAVKDAKKQGVEWVETTVREGDPAEEITAFARDGDFDMLVIGSRGLGSVKGLLLGSVSSKVCHLTDRTCVTVK
ncbi:MAG: universal stress protein [Desulfobacterales bacterium]|nr:MAG: universal stress protein [Desulfobacterales bacterium]